MSSKGKPVKWKRPDRDSKMPLPAIRSQQDVRVEASVLVSNKKRTRRRERALKQTSMQEFTTEKPAWTPRYPCGTCGTLSRVPEALTCEGCVTSHAHKCFACREQVETTIPLLDSITYADFCAKLSLPFTYDPNSHLAHARWKEMHEHEDLIRHYFFAGDPFADVRRLSGDQGTWHHEPGMEIWRTYFLCLHCFEEQKWTVPLPVAARNYRYSDGVFFRNLEMNVRHLADTSKHVFKHDRARDFHRDYVSTWVLQRDLTKEAYKVLRDEWDRKRGVEPEPDSVLLFAN